MFKEIIIAGCGGFVGTAGRYLVGKWSAGMWHGAFPMGTFLVNVIGCFIIGLFFGLLEHAKVMTPSENVLLITGFAVASLHSAHLPMTCGFWVARVTGSLSDFTLA